MAVEPLSMFTRWSAPGAARAATPALVLAALFVLAACGSGGGSSAGGGEPLGSASGAASEPAPEPASEPAPSPDSESAARPPDRPATMDLTVTEEQMQIQLPAVLLAPEGLPFSTYLFKDFQEESVDDPLPGVRVADDLKSPAFMMEVLFYPDDESKDDAAQAFAKAVEDVGGSVERGVPIRPWAVDSAIADHGDTADVFFLGTHGGRWFMIHQRFDWATVEQFGGVLDGFLKEWQWTDDGTYLVQRSE